MGRYTRIGIVLAIVASAAISMPRIASSREEVRDVTLVVRGMTYYVDGSNDPNPVLRLRAGEQVRVTLRNEDQGISHDFNIRAWDVATKVLEGKGQDSVVFRVPAGAAAVNTSYTCTPHAAMMSGSIVIE